jgi:hypothetical protein
MFLNAVSADQAGVTVREFVWRNKCNDLSPHSVRFLWNAKVDSIFVLTTREASMPLFHFNSFTGDMFLPDPDGEELADVAAAHVAAEQSAREALIEAVKTGDVAPDYIQVTDSDGHEVTTVFLDRLLRGWPRKIVRGVLVNVRFGRLRPTISSATLSSASQLKQPPRIERIKPRRRRGWAKPQVSTTATVPSVEPFLSAAHSIMAKIGLAGLSDEGR